MNGDRTDSPALQLQGVTRRFGATPVLRGIDLDLPAGGRLALLGPNGSGKTTLLRLAAGLLRPTKGTARVHGHDPLHLEGRRRLGFVGQDAGIYPELTPKEHLRWWADLHQKAVDADAWLARAGIAHHKERAGTMSRGQRQRLRLAMALSTGPSLLLLDEPEAPLDVAGRDWLRAELDAHEGAVVMATHLDTRFPVRTLQRGRFTEDA